MPSFQEFHYQIIFSVNTDNDEVFKKCFNHYWSFRYHHDGDAGIDLNSLYDVIGNSSEVSALYFKIQGEMIK